MPEVVHILFLCVANSARSQLAEGLAQRIFGHQAIVKSAGSAPSGKIDPWAVHTLKQEGIDISHHRSKSIEELPKEFLAKLDYVITLCAEEFCPSLPSTAKHLHWPIQDPASVPEEQKAQAFEMAKNEIKVKLERLKSELIPG